MVPTVGVFWTLELGHLLLRDTGAAGELSLVAHG